MKGRENSQQGLTSELYAHGVLKPFLPWFLSIAGPMDESECALFQQDGARLHGGASCRDVLDLFPGRLVNWPPRSPDLSPIEFIWARCEKIIEHMMKQGQRFTTHDAFVAAINEAFYRATTPAQIKEAYFTTYCNVGETLRGHGSNRFSTTSWKRQYPLTREGDMSRQ